MNAVSEYNFMAIYFYMTVYIFFPYKEKHNAKVYNWLYWYTSTFFIYSKINFQIETMITKTIALKKTM